jgi:D-threo-aldose 1-dehydrogenase
MVAPGGPRWPPVEVLLGHKEEGLNEHLGVAGGPIDLMIRYMRTGFFESVITHNRYTLVNRTAEPLLGVAAELGVAALNAAPYGSGILAKGPDSYARYEYGEASREVVERVRKMQYECRQFGVPLGAAALQFSLRDPRVVSTIVGISRPERVKQTLDFASHPVPEELWERLESCLVAPLGQFAEVEVPDCFARHQPSAKIKKLMTESRRLIACIVESAAPHR